MWEAGAAQAGWQELDGGQAMHGGRTGRHGILTVSPSLGLAALMVFPHDRPLIAGREDRLLREDTHLGWPLAVGMGNCSVGT
jgi:hypothetical protein